MVAERERVGVERRLAAEYGFGVHFTERDDGRLTVARERSRYVPVTYITPMQGNQAALGFDLASEPTRRAAVEQAERTGLPVASGRILSVQQANEYSFLLFWPIFATTGQPHRMTGLVLGLFRIDDVVAAATIRGRLPAAGCCCSTGLPRRPNRYCIRVTWVVVWTTCWQRPASLPTSWSAAGSGASSSCRRTGDGSANLASRAASSWPVACF